MTSIKNYDLFSSSLKQKIKIDERAIEKFQKKSKAMLELINYIDTLIKLDKESYEIEADIGKGIFVKAIQNTSSKSLIVNIGLNVYIDLPYEDAKKVIIKQKDIIEKKIYLLEKEIIKNKSYIKLTKTLAETLKKQQILDGNYEENKEFEELENTISSINI